MRTYKTVETSTVINYNSDLSGELFIGNPTETTIKLTYNELYEFMTKVEVEDLLYTLEDIMDNPNNRTIEKIAILKNCVKELEKE